MNTRSAPAALRDKHIYAQWQDISVDLFKARWPSFSPQELACKGTGRVMLDFRALDMLQALRNRLGRPIILTSAYRSPEHNTAVGGARRSNHMEGIAYDVVMTNQNPELFERAAVASGFRGIGHYPASNFMHIDARISENVVRFKGTGRNNRWFFEGLPSAGSSGSVGQAEIIPDFTAPVAPTTMDTVKELTPVLGPIVLGPMVALGSGDGPVQWAIGAVVLIAAAIGVIYMIKKNKRGEEEENA